MAYTIDSKSIARNGLWVQVPPWAPIRRNVMKNTIIALSVSAFLISNVALADGRYYPPVPPQHTPTYYPPPNLHHAPYYGNYYRYYNNNHSSDDAAWAIGGLVVGAIIGAAANENRNRQAQPTQSAPAPTRIIRLCEEHISIDAQGKTTTERTCRDEIVQ